MTDETNVTKDSDYTAEELTTTDVEKPEVILAAEQEAWREQTIKDLRKEYQGEVDVARKEIEKNLNKQYSEAFAKMTEDWKKEQTPLSQDELQKLLDAEFPEFQVKVSLGGEKEIATIRELGCKQERKFVRLLQEKAGAHYRILSGVILEFSAGQSTEEKIESLFKSVEPLADVLCEATALVLSAALNRPITKEIVDEYLSASRQLSYVRAQIEANKIRDFFLQGSPTLENVDEEEEEPPKYPYLATVYSWTEAFSLPPDEMRTKFRKSELALFGYRSRESSILMKKRMNKKTKAPANAPVVLQQQEENDELDFRKMTGNQAVAHLNNLGFRIPIVAR